jgi:hypothetical protein
MSEALRGIEVAIERLLFDRVAQNKLAGFTVETAREIVALISEETNCKPRRRIVLLAKLEADDWRTLQSDLRHLETEIAMHGKLPSSSVSGGYSSGHIIVTSEDGSIDHDSWALELNSYLEALKQREQLNTCQRPEGER